MLKATVYLNFNGDCEEAFLFYRSVFGGDFTYLGKFKDMPNQEGMPELSKEMGERVLHVGLPVGESLIMGSDNVGEAAERYKQGNNFSISLNLDSKEEADNYFRKLSEGGMVEMPMQNTFWGDYFGMTTDKFGISWMVSAGSEESG
jgi:PhnB protein